MANITLYVRNPADNELIPIVYVDQGDGTYALRVQAGAAVPVGGATPWKHLSVQATVQEIKATPATLYSLHVMNMSDAVLYLKIFNRTAAAVDVGTTEPEFTFAVPTGGDVFGKGFTHNFGIVGAKFDVALSLNCTTGLHTNSTGSPDPSKCVVNLTYK